ncbi:thioredoxin domain-containing protein 5-like [Mercenaria mercenaria]|uniref:thioredoxin domain-containing protein 5-like n=1 Tax=Mercenaria mercenaria TaxID=6596 RepID=UPI00234E7F04|nr:thioredoxin domain-containing protein 5-like [Mercenaria mercenaria]
MQKYIFSCLICICFIGLSKSDDHGENAVTYTKETFDAAIAEEEILFVMFYAPWCGHCKRLAPTWDDLAKEINVEDRKLTVGKVDCTKEPGLCGEHQVRGYPTVKWFHGTNLGIKYGNKRTIEDLRAFVEESLAKSETLDKQKTLKKPEDKADEKTEGAEVKKPEVIVTDGLYDLSDETFESHVATGHHFIKFFAPWCGHCQRLAPTWEQLARETKDNEKVKIAKVDCTKQRNTCTKFGIRGYPTLIWFTNGEKSEDYRGQRSLDELSKFVTKMSSVESETAKTSKDGKVPDVLEDEPEVCCGMKEEDFKDSVSQDFTLVVFDNDE